MPLLDVLGWRWKDAANLTSPAPPTLEQSRELAKDLVLAGKPLEAAVFLCPGWKHGQTFTASQDRWRLDSFAPRSRAATRKDLGRGATFDAELRSAVSGDDDAELAVSGDRRTFARVVHNVLDEDDCADLIRCINQKGFTPALLNIGNGRQRYEPDVRNGHRAIVDNQELSSYLLEMLRPHLPGMIQGSHLVDLNERCRVLCYTPGQEQGWAIKQELLFRKGGPLIQNSQEFGPHYDGCFVRPRGSRNEGDESMVTVQLYLHDVPESSGGATTFLAGGRGAGPKEALPCQPRAGSVLLFTQNLLHEGSLVTSGLKYTLRTEAMYRPAA
eukprot:s877_g2.t1